MVQQFETKREQKLVLRELEQDLAVLQHDLVQDAAEDLVGNRLSDQDNFFFLFLGHFNQVSVTPLLF